VTELVLAGSLGHAEQAFAEAADQFGDLAVVEVLSNIPPQVTALHMAGFDGGKMSLATLLVPPKAWADSLAFFAATWPDDLIEDDPERIAESLFAHIHGVVFSTDDEERRVELLQAASATDHGATAFAILFSMAPKEILEVAGEIISKGPYLTGQTSSDNDVVPLAIALAQASEDGWDRALFELFPEFRHSADLADAEYSATTRTRSRPSCSAPPRSCCTACASRCRRRAAPSRVRAAAWARASSRDRRELIHAASNCRRKFTAPDARDPATVATHPDDEAAYALADELTGITAMVAEKFTNDRTADGIQKALQMTVGGVSLGLDQAC
jgi:hypothetical protein